MKRLLSVMCLSSLFLGPAFGAGYTTVRSGDVTDTSHLTGPWCATSSPCTVPGPGDTVVIANGHTLNLPADASWTIGNSADLATYALATTGTGGTGIFSMQMHSTLTLHGHVRQGNATWQVGTSGGGAYVVFNHSTTPLTWIISDGTLQANARLVILGAPGDRSVVRKSATGVAGGGFGPLTTQQDGGRVEAQYTNFEFIGNATISAFRFRGTSAVFTLSLQHVTLTSCGQITNISAAFSGTSNILLEYFKVVTPIASSNRIISFAAGPRTTGTWSFQNWSISGGTFHCQPVAVGNALGATFSNIFIRNTSNIMPFNCSNAHLGTVTNLFHYVASSTAGGSAIGGADVNGAYLLEETPWDGNGHPIQSLAFNQTWSKWIIEATNGQFQADGLQTMHSQSLTGQRITLRDGVVVQPAGTYYGSPINHTATSPNDATHNYPAITARNITWRGGLNGSISSGIGGEANAGAAGLFSAVHNNVVWSEVPSTPAYITDYSVLPGNGTFTSADYNCHWNIASTNGTRYKYAVTNPGVYDTAPGVNDRNVNPRLADTTRTFLKWGKSINPSHATVGVVLDEMAKLADDSGFDPRYTIANALTWVRWGNVPQEPRLWTAFDGSYCGGVDPTPLRLAAGAASAL
jgi:hypothetical protein